MIRLSAFADEISPDLNEQIAVLNSENIHFLDLRSALKCVLPTPLGRGYASRQEARKAACGGEERKKDFRGTPPRPWQRGAALCTPALCGRRIGSVHGSRPPISSLKATVT